MNWFDKHLRTLLLVLIASIQLALPNMYSAGSDIDDLEKEQLSEEEKAEILAECDELDEDPDLDPEHLDQLCEEFNDPGFLHNITNQREVFLEKVEKINNTPVVVFDGLGIVRNYDPSLANFNLDDLFHGENPIQFPRNVHLGIFAKDLLKPAFHFGSLLLDIDCMAEYFDSIIEIIANAIIHKEENVLFNLNIMLETNDADLFAATFKNLDETLHKAMMHKNQMDRLKIKFFTRRILPMCLERISQC